MLNNKSKTSIEITDNAVLRYDKTMYAAVRSNNHGCYYEPFHHVNGVETNVIEAGSFKISNPAAVTEFRIKSSGFVNDSFAVAIGKDKPEQIIYERPLSEDAKVYDVNTETAASVPYSEFKVFVIVHLVPGPHDWLALAEGAPTADIEAIQNAMSSECRAYDPQSASSSMPTDGFYADSIEIEMLFD